jgi:hypothetical protein
MNRLLLIVAVVCFVAGAIACAYWGTHYSHTAVALRRARQTICPPVPADTPMKEFPTACRDAMIPK